MQWGYSQGLITSGLLSPVPLIPRGPGIGNEGWDIIGGSLDLEKREYGKNSGLKLITVPASRSSMSESFKRHQLK
ncbi:hypothetical protein PMIN07_011305 [Paraphaeosphaeria minitans]